MKNSRLVYRTDSGRICKDCQRPTPKCVCRKNRRPLKNDGIIRLRREVKGRKGKTVTVITGFQLDKAGLKNMAARLKRACGSGGTVKDGVIIIQGDHRDLLAAELKKTDHIVKMAGG